MKSKLKIMYVKMKYYSALSRPKFFQPFMNAEM